MRNNSNYLAHIKGLRGTSLYFAINRKLGNLYKDYEKECNTERKAEICIELLNSIQDTIVWKLRIRVRAFEEDVRLFFAQFGQRKTIDHSDKRCKDYYSVAVIVKNEARYLREFILFYQATGADRIYLYDNDSTDDIIKVLTPFLEAGFVVYRHWPGRSVQTAAYRDAIRRAKKRTKWLALIDIDEFLFSPKGSMPSQLSAYEEHPGVGVNWVIFGPNGHDRRPDGLVMENYTSTINDYDADYNCHIKSIVQPGKVFTINNTHYAYYKNGGFAVSETGERIDNASAHLYAQGRAFTSHNHRDIFRINHYITKSLEDLEAKCLRGYADGAPASTKEIQLRPFQKSISEDYTIKPYINIVRANY